MSTASPYRLCPKCQSHRGVDEFVCANESGGVLCGWDLTNEEIHDGRPDPQPEASGGSAGSGGPPVLHCPNGHVVSEGDLICPECNAELQPTAPTQEIAGWGVLSEMSTEGSVRSRFRVRRPSDGREAVLTLYSPGAEPDTTVYEALQKRVSRDHIAELIEFGRWDGQAYEVAEEIHGGSLASLVIEPSDTAIIRRIVEEIGTALASFMDVGLRHRSLSPDKILVRSREPLDVVISGFESGRLSDLDLDIESPLEVTRYTAPEAIMGGVASASDWWGLGMILLGILTRGDCFSGINDQLFLIHVNANGAPIPAGLEPRLEMLLQGLLTVDRSQRWQWKEVRAWLDGESPPVAKGKRGEAASETGPTISLGGKTYRDARAFAIDASRAGNWHEACDLLAHGQIALWAEELKLDGRAVSALRGLGQRVEPAVGFRLSVALQILNPQLPLIFEEAIVNPAWLLNNPAAGYELISGPIPDLLSQYGLQSDNWLQRLAKRASAIRARAESLEITLDEEVFQVLALSTSRARLTAAWETRRRDFPDASHPSLFSILERRQYSDEDLIILLAATIDQFRSCQEIIHEVNEMSSRYALPVPASEAVQGYLTRTRRELYALLDERIAGFARCGHERCDAWADQFRLERRLPIATVLILLNRNPGDWAKPPHQEYVSSVLDFFEKKVSGAILRGQLVRMTIAKTTPRIDIAELASDLGSAAALLENLLQRSDRTFQLESEMFESTDGPEKRMRNLLGRTLQYQRDTGINGSYIGFPFLLRRDRAEKSTARLAPILLWPVKLVGQSGSRGDFSLSFDSEGREVLLNPAFTGMFGLEGAKSWQEVADDVLMRSVAKLADIVDAFGVKAEPTGRTLTPLPRDLSGVAPGEQRCVCSAVLFHMEFMGQSLVEDLRQLKQRPPENSALEPMLRVGQVAPQAAGASDGAAARITTSDRFLITDSDPSQEEAIARARSSPGLLIQGPPGTGKSQTIVNLVADCIGHRKSVLIVCQKLPALEVVKKRLVATGLENRLAMVTNVVKDRQPLLRAIRDQLDTLTVADVSQARQNERDAGVLATQIEKLETQIDAQYHTAVRVDETSGRTYRQLLGELISLEESTSQTLDVVGLRRLLASRSAPDVAEVVESCAAIASQWLDAEFEGSPLSATTQFPHDDATIREFRELLQALLDAEDARSQLPAVQSRVLPTDAPDGLGAWLVKYGAFLEELSDAKLRAASSLVPAFRGERIGSTYRRVLETVLALERGERRKAICPQDLSPLLATLAEEHVEQLATTTREHATLWLAARYEGSPLHVLLPAVVRDDTVATFTACMQELQEAEAARLQIGLPRALATDAGGSRNLPEWLQTQRPIVGLDDPRPLKEWIATHGEVILRVVTTDGESIRSLLTLFADSADGNQYADVITHLLNSLDAFRDPFPYYPELAQLLAEVELASVSKMATACASVIDSSLEVAVDKVLYESLSSFPRDTQSTAALRSKIEAFAEAEKRWSGARARQATGITLDDGGALKAWLTQNEAVVLQAPENVLNEVAKSHLLFRRDQAGKSPAEVLHAKLQKLRAQIQAVQPEQHNQPVMSVLAGLAPEQLTELKQQAVLATSTGTFSFLNPKRFKARNAILRWCRSVGINRREVTYSSISQCIGCETTLRTVYEAAVGVLQPAGVVLQWRGWEQLQSELTRLIDLLPALHKIRSAIQRLPCTFAKDRFLASANSLSFRRLWAALQTLVETDTARQACRNALSNLRLDMSREWLAERDSALAGDTPPADGVSSCKDVLAALPQIDRWQAHCQRVSGFDQVTLKVLGLLNEARDWIRTLQPDERVRHVDALVNRHALLAHKQSLESKHKISPIGSSLECTALASLCDRLINAKQAVNALASCPARAEFELPLRSCRGPDIEAALADFRKAVQYAEARIRSITALRTLEPWVQSPWIAACENAIQSGSPTQQIVRPLIDALPYAVRYQEFRDVLSKADPLLSKVFACFSPHRQVLEALPHEDISHEMGRGIRCTKTWYSKKTLETTYPELLRLKTNTPEEVMSALVVLGDAANITQAIDDSPLGNAFVAAIANGSANALHDLMADVQRLEERGKAYRHSRSCLTTLQSWMQPEWTALVQRSLSANGDVRPGLQLLLEASQRLRPYQLFRARASQVPAEALQVFEHLAKHRGTLRILASQAPEGDVGHVVRKVLRREALLGWKSRLEAAEPSLLSDGQEMAAQVKQLAKLDAALQDLNKTRLANDVPLHEISAAGEWADITRLTGPRAVRLREFFRRGQLLGLLPLRPVWLTTPDVASQLLPLDKSLFDLVIFDEASQMPVEYALPSLFRAKTSVVSGDDKQMPPSSFFASRIESDETEVFDGDMPDEHTTDQERDAFEQAWNRREIKDCPDLLNLGDAVLRRSTLQVHYRSAYRELIGYSNAAFYKNELGVPVRHPDEAVRAAKPIEYLDVNGVYANKTNPDEARKVVEVLADLWLTGSAVPPSVGVVTFNLNQAELIDQFLEERAEADAQFRTAYIREQDRVDNGEDMSVFIKNVENVQGDERDLIIFSTTFGRTIKGSFSRNFGVLGQKGGERRLNVAVTRARQKVIVVSSIPVDEVSDMLRTRGKPETPRDYLQAYLHYARLVSEGHLEESRRLASRLVTAGSVAESSGGTLDGFLDSVATFIRSLGYEPVNTANDPILGVDFSIRDPVTGLFGVGIECDPPRHRLTQRARAREIWRPRVLQRAYRVVHRISPYAWYHDRDRERERLRKVLAGALGTNAVPSNNVGRTKP
jgi:hypothetical protein